MTFNPEDDKITRIMEMRQYGRLYGYRLFTEHFPRGEPHVHILMLEGNHQKGYSKLLKLYLQETGK